MSIDRGIRACQLTPYAAGELVPVPDCDIREEGILSTFHRQGKIRVEFVGKKDFPKSIILRARVKTLPIENRSTQAQLIVNKIVMTPAPYYGMESLFPDDEVLAQLSLYRGVELYFTGYRVFNDKYFQGDEFQEIKLVLTPDKIVLRKEFRVQTAPHLLQKNIRNDAGEWIITSPYGQEKRESTPIMGYGGFYKTGIDIDKIQPVFAVLSSVRDDTRVKLYSLLHLEQERIVPPDGGIKGGSHWYFTEGLPSDQYISLGDSIRRGRARITLQHLLTKEEITYVSKDYQQPNRKGEDIDIIFIPQLNEERK